MARFQPALEKLLRLEGGWCSVPGDRGGETYCGISRAHWPTWEGWTTIIKAKAHSSFVEGPEAFSEHLAGIPTLRRWTSSTARTSGTPCTATCCPRNSRKSFLNRP